MFLYGWLDRNYTGYSAEFVRLFYPIIYLPGWSSQLTRGARFKYRMATKTKAFRWQDFDYACSESELNRKADVLVCFNGFPYAQPNTPAKAFHGMKVYHAFEFVFRAAEANRLFEAAGVDCLMGYASHDRHSGFFRKHYPAFVGKVIPVPFGFGRRFVADSEAEPAGRTAKVIAMGAVNPVDDHTVEDRDALADYRQFYSDRFWTHQWRHTLREHEADLADIMDSVLPRYPATNNAAYDAVDLCRRYAMFANDEGLMAFPPARTYEATAAGAVMVSGDHDCFHDLGFKDGETCIMHRPGDVADFREKVSHYIRNPAQLAAVARAGRDMVRERFSHEQVARDLHRAISQRYQRSAA